MSIHMYMLRNLSSQPVSRYRNNIWKKMTLDSAFWSGADFMKLYAISCNKYFIFIFLGMPVSLRILIDKIQAAILNSHCKFATKRNCQKKNKIIMRLECFKLFLFIFPLHWFRLWIVLKWLQFHSLLH